jgi:hypothetical protein
LEDEDSPYVKALNWLINEDPLELTVDSENFVQRYTAAYFYFATSIISPWFSCGAAVGDETKKCFSQRMVSTIPIVYQPFPSIRWNSEENECNWSGIFCDDEGQIRAIEISKYSVAADGAAVVCFRVSHKFI